MKLKQLFFAGCLSTGMLAVDLANAQESQVSVEENGISNVQFEAPVKLKIGSQPIKVEAPGFACPSMADMNGDGHKDLLVGQFSGGKIKIYHSDGKQGFESGDWLKAEGKVAEIPGVW